MFYQIWSIDYRENIATFDNLPSAEAAFDDYRLTWPDEAIMLRKVENLKDSRDETETG